MQLPLAFKSIMLGINQMMLMVLATVIIAALIGGGALGLLSLGGFQKPHSKIGDGVAAGVSIVLLAIVLDRLTQAWGRPRPDHRQLNQGEKREQDHIGRWSRARARRCARARRGGVRRRRR